MTEKLTGGPCPKCGYVDEESGPDALPQRSLLQDKYVVGRVLDSNGEGFSYIGFDQEDGVPVTVREFFPRGHCTRDGRSVLVRPGDEADYSAALHDFLNLQRTLYSLNGLAGLLPVKSIFEENGTAYCITERLRGASLREYLPRGGGTLNYEQVKALFVPLIPTIHTLHEAGVIHGAISADTLVLCGDGKLRLTGFCTNAARTEGGFIEAQLFPGYAAIEQYGTIGELGPATDIYGLTASMYRVLVGNPPPVAPERLNDDTLTVPARVADTLPPGILEMLSAGLQILPEDRPRSVEDLRVYFVNAAIRSHETDPKEERRREKQRKKEEKRRKKGSSAKWYGIVAAGATVVILLGGVAFALIKTGVWTPFASNDTSGLSSIDFSPSSNAPPKEESSKEKVYKMPEFVGQSYIDILDNLEYTDDFQFEIVQKEYSSRYPAGTVIKQSPEANTVTSKGAKVSLYISLGPSKLTVPDLRGKTPDEAYLQLYKSGFPFYSVAEREKYDESMDPGVIVEVSPKPGTRVSPDEPIIIYVNPERDDDEYYEDDGSSGSSWGSSSSRSSSSSSGGRW